MLCLVSDNVFQYGRSQAWEKARSVMKGVVVSVNVALKNFVADETLQVH